MIAKISRPWKTLDPTVVELEGIDVVAGDVKNKHRPH